MDIKAFSYCLEMAKPLEGITIYLNNGTYFEFEFPKEIKISDDKNCIFFNVPYKKELQHCVGIDAIVNVAYIQECGDE